ncbi:MAG: sensor histidine kinase [Nannocystales bacterium]
MTPIRSLRLRFLLAFGLFGALLTVIYGAVAWASTTLSEDLIMERWLESEAQHIQQRYLEQREVALPTGRLISGAIEVERLPLALRARAGALAVGPHEVLGPGEGRWQLHVLQLPAGPRVYLYINENDLEASELVEQQLGWLLLGLSALVALIGVGLGVLTTRRIIAPLRRLTEAVSAHEPDAPLPSLRELVSNDELGLLAEHMETAMGQVAASARQEQLFGRYTSHELRSSLAVARGVSELLDDLDDPRLSRPLARLDRALQDMGGIVETCLWLARSQAQMPPCEHVELRPLIDELVARVGRRVSPGVALRVDVPSDAFVNAPRLALRMILSNLLGNALRHTVEGSIVLRGDTDGIEVEDSGPGIPDEIRVRITEPYVRGPGEGHGLGLAIVNGLCVRLGWRFDVQSVVGRGTKVRVELTGAPDRPSQ